MDTKQIFGKHYERLATEGILKSVIAGSAVAFGINTVFAFLYWMFGLGAIWLGAVIGIPLGAVCGVILYFLRCRLNEKVIAARIDRLGGLEERMITMVELDGESTCIAKLQRSDALDNLANLPEKSVRFRFPTSLIATLSLVFVISVSLIVLGVLANDGKIPYGKDMLAQGADGAFDVTYATDGGGYIRGELNQKVSLGQSTSPVRAVADDGWMFIRWDDGEMCPERSEESVNTDMVIKAVFKKIDAGDPDEDDSDSADDLPTGDVTVEGGGGDSDQQGGENIKNDGQGNGSGKWQDRNQFIDGATYYRDYLELYYQYAMGIFDSDTEIPPEILEFFETYFSGI